MGTPIAVIYQLPSDLAEPLYVNLETREICIDLDGVQISLRCDENLRPLLQRWLDEVVRFSAFTP